jgi:hypothetical protein
MPIKKKDWAAILRGLAQATQIPYQVQQLKEAQARQATEDEITQSDAIIRAAQAQQVQTEVQEAERLRNYIKQAAMTKYGKPTGLAGAIASGDVADPASKMKFALEGLQKPVPDVTRAKAEVEGLKAQGFTDADIRAMKSKKVGTGVYMMEVLQDPSMSEEMKNFARLYLSKPSQEQWEFKKKIFQNPGAYSDDQKRALGIRVVEGKSITTSQIDQVWQDYMTFNPKWDKLSTTELRDELNAFGRSRLPELWVDYNIYEVEEERKTISKLMGYKITGKKVTAKNPNKFDIERARKELKAEGYTDEQIDAALKKRGYK